MYEKAEKAKQLFLNGYNCSQAVFGAFAEDFGLDFETAIKLSSSFGGGMGRLREVCGAISGAFMVVGLKFGYTSPKDIDSKAAHYKLIQDMATAFKLENGSIVCRDLIDEGKQTPTYIPSDRNEKYYKKRPCAEYVYIAAKITQDALNGKFFG